MGAFLKAPDKNDQRAEDHAYMLLLCRSASLRDLLDMVEAELEVLNGLVEGERGFHGLIDSMVYLGAFYIPKA